MYKNMFLNAEDKLLNELSSLYHSYGYRQFKMSKFEEYDLYVKNKRFLVSDNIITFTDTNGKLLALKPDVTLSIVNGTADKINGIEKLFYRENVYRPDNETRYFKEIVQVGLECIGNLDDFSITETLLLAANSLETISSEYIIDISDIDLILEVLKREFVNNDLKEIFVDLIKHKNRHELEQMCIANNINFIPFKTLLSCEGTPNEVFDVLLNLYDDKAWRNSVERFVSIVSVLPTDKIRIDFSLIKDTNYYNGIVFSGYIYGISTSILSGGQYDYLMKKMGKKAKAIGFAVYLDKIEDFLYSAPEYDVDFVLLYSNTDDLISVMNYSNELRKKGNSVILASSIPNDIRYKEIIDFSKKEVDI